MLPSGIDLDTFRSARRRIVDHVVQTPVTRIDGGRVSLKLESLQVSGSFKARGALNKVLSLDDDVLRRGIITASGGNHGLAVAFAGHVKGVPTIVYLPSRTPEAKAKRIEQWGARVVRVGDVWDDAHAAAVEHGARDGLTYVHPFADPTVIGGQGTIALEALEQMPDVDLFVVAIGGGGLVSGVAAAAKLLRPSVRVIGVEPVGAPTLHESLRAGRVIELPRIETAAGTLAPRRSDPLNFEIIRETVDTVALVSDDEMKTAARFLLSELGIAVELSGAAALAAVRSGKADLRDSRRPCVLVCGAGRDGL